MTLKAELYWSFRSPYSYLGARHYRQIAGQYDLEIELRVVYPLAIRNPDFFTHQNPLWIPYIIRDCQRVAEHRGLPFSLPSPDPVVQDMATRAIADDQPHIHRLTRLGAEATRRGRGLAFIDEISMMIWGDGVQGWDQGAHMAEATARAGLVLGDMEAAIAGHEDELDADISANQKALEAAGHWGVPCLVFDGEPFHGQDRIELAVWRMQQKGLTARA